MSDAFLVAGEGYRPGGGETSREISGSAGAPVGSGPTNIGSGWAVSYFPFFCFSFFQQAKSFSTCSAALVSTIRQLRHTEERTRTDGRTDVDTHSPACVWGGNFTLSCNDSDNHPVAHLMQGQKTNRTGGICDCTCVNAL